MKKIYLLTQDVKELMSQWATRKGFRLPENEFFEKMHKELREKLNQVFEGGIKIKTISYITLVKKLNELVRKYKKSAKLVTLDLLYVPKADYFVEINRVNEFKNGKWYDIGVCSRPGYPNLSLQVEKISLDLKRRFLHPTVVLVDDGCWEATSLNIVFSLFQSQGINISQILVGIMVERGENSPATKLIKCAYSYPISELVDWVCERDFYPGVPLSGRTVGKLTKDGPVPIIPSTGALYLEGFGDPEKWASIPCSKKREFSIFCLNQAIRMFQEIERVSNRIILVEDLDRYPFGKEFIGKNKIIESLKRKLEELEK